MSIECHPGGPGLNIPQHQAPGRRNKEINTEMARHDILAVVYLVITPCLSKEKKIITKSIVLSQNPTLLVFPYKGHPVPVCQRTQCSPSWYIEAFKHNSSHLLSWPWMCPDIWDQQHVRGFIHLPPGPKLTVIDCPTVRQREGKIHPNDASIDVCN